MTPITVSVTVDRPADDVFAYATDPARFHEWQDDVVDGRFEGEERVGARCVTTRRIGFADRRIASEVTALDPPCHWAISGVDGPIRATVTVDVAPESDARSALTIGVDFDGHGIGRLLVTLVVRRQAREEMPGNVARLKRQLETAEPS